MEVNQIGCSIETPSHTQNSLHHVIMLGLEFFFLAWEEVTRTASEPVVSIKVIDGIKWTCCMLAEDDGLCGSEQVA